MSIWANMQLRTKLFTCFLSLAFLTGVTGIAGYITSDRIGDRAENVGAKLAPLGDAAMEIKLAATTAHLKFEEIMAGDQTESIDEVWKLLKETQFYVNAILDGAENDEGHFYATESPEVRAKIESVRTKVEAFIDATRKRYEQRVSAAGVGTGADAAFDKLYDGAQKELDEIIGRSANLTTSEVRPILLHAGNAKFRLANGHLFLEELLSGDDGNKIEDVIKDFQTARNDVRQLRAIGVRDSAAKADKLIGDIIAVAKQRYDRTKGQNKVGGEVETIFDNSFDSFIKEADEAEELIHKAMETGLTEMQTDHSRGLILVIAITGVAVFLAFALAVMIGSQVSGRVIELADTMRHLADGNLNAEVRFNDAQDEISGMARAVQIFKENAIERERLEAEQAREQETREARAKRMEELTESFDHNVANILEALSSASTEMHSTSESMSATAEETSQQAMSVSAISEQASSNVQTVASATEELNVSIKDIARQMNDTSQAARGASEEAQQTQGAVRALADSAQKIGDVISLITDIAEQTNLLALNATIEAARAGDAGKGFAVVASEVKSLANQTAKATEDIATQINAVRDQVDGTVGNIESVVKRIEMINDIATTVAAAVEEQQAATQEIARNAEEAANGTQEVAKTFVNVKEAANETGTASSQVLSSAQQLASQSDEMKRFVERFLADIRAA